jgi:hypothetical protein
VIQLDTYPGLARADQAEEHLELRVDRRHDRPGADHRPAAGVEALDLDVVLALHAQRQLDLSAPAEVEGVLGRHADPAASECMPATPSCARALIPYAIASPPAPVVRCSIVSTGITRSCRLLPPCTKLSVFLPISNTAIPAGIISCSPSTPS